MSYRIRHVISLEMIERTFAIGFKKSDSFFYRTSFAFPIDGFIHFITSAQLFEMLSKEDPKFIYKRGGRGGKILHQEEDGEVYGKVGYLYDKVGYTDYFIDHSLNLAIIKTEIEANENNEKETAYSSENLILGQDVFLLGFPYLGDLQYKYEWHFGLPMPLIIPLVRKTTISMIQHPTFLLDKQDNFWFSGGPVVFWDYIEKRQKICGIVAHYPMEKDAEPSTMFGQQRLGFGIAYDISVIKKIIEAEKIKRN